MGAHNKNSCLATATVLVAWSVGVAAQEPETPPAPQASSSQSLRRLFVSDRLVLNVYAAPDQAGGRVATIETGDAIDELERSGNFVHVRLADGRDGWVGANYLTDAMPAATRLRELQEKQRSAGAPAETKAAEEITRLKKEAATLQAKLSELKAAAVSSPESAPVASSSVTTDSQTLPITPQSANIRSWIWVCAVVLAAGTGFFAGYRTIAVRIRKRFGRLKVY